MNQFDQSSGECLERVEPFELAAPAQLKAELDERFNRIDERFERVDGRLEKGDSRFERIEVRLQEEGDKYRRHVDVLWERMISERNLVLDVGMAANANVAKLRALNAADHLRFEETLTDHEVRLSRLEP